ncbi:MAG: TonB-dependent receptor [Sphingomonas sp.]
MLVYSSVSTGYKAGGFNISSDASPYGPENITAYEFGIKSEFWDRRARVNLDSFYYDYGDMQLTTLGTFGPSNAPGQFTVNAGKSRIYGIELDSQFKVTRALLLMASYALTSARFTRLVNMDPRTNVTRNLSGNVVPYVSRHVINLGAQYEVDLGSSGSLTLAANYNWHSKKYLREFNDPVIDLVPANGRTDVTVSYKVADTGIKLTGFVTNLENDVEKNNIYISPGFIGLSAVTSYTRPRTFGIRADFSF